MMTPHAVRSLLAALVVIVAGLVARPAMAGGVKAEKSTLEENLEAHNWKLKLVINYGSTPDRDVIPMSFSFKQTATYERSLTDESPNKPVSRTVPMVNQVPNISEQEVAFSDPATGKRFSSTKFPITLRRKDDFEAGEYELTIKAGGRTVGTVKLQLKGENKAIDRRSLSFGAGGVTGSGKKKDDAASKADAPEKASGAAEEQGPDLSDIPSVPAEDAAVASEVPAVPPRQGGCGCRVSGESPSGKVGLLSVLGLALAFSRRRR